MQGERGWQDRGGVRVWSRLTVLVPLLAWLQEDAVATQDEFGRARVQLAQGAVVRWRWAQGPDGQQVAQSNARFVRWEDGTTQLLLGDEVRGRNIFLNIISVFGLCCMCPRANTMHGHM